MEAFLGFLSESSIRAAVIAVSVSIVLFGMRVKSPAIRHRAWTGVLLVMLLLPVLSLWVPRIELPLLLPPSNDLTHGPSSVDLGRSPSSDDRIPAVEATGSDGSDFVQSSSPAENGKRSRFRSGVLEALVAIYLIGFVIFAVKILAGMVLSCRLARNASRDDKCSYSSRVSAPLTIGLFRARILLPLEAKQWDSARLSAVLTHEREHVRRHDPLVGWLGLLNRCVYWFHPLAWWLCCKLSALSEQLCDEAVITRGHDPGQYAEYLLEFARTVKQRGALVTPWGSSLHGSILALRIRSVVTVGRSPAISRARLVLVTGLCAGATIVPAVCTLAHAQSAVFNAPAVTRQATTDQRADSTLNQSQPGRSNPLADSDSILYRRAMDLLENHRYEEARRDFQKLINTFPDSNLLASSYLAIGDSFNDEGGTENLREAEDQYKNFVVFFPTDSRAPEAWVRAISIGVNRINTGDGSREYALKLESEAKRFINQHPDSDYVPIVRQYLREIQKSIGTGQPNLFGSPDMRILVEMLHVLRLHDQTR